jgi:transketolase
MSKRWLIWLAKGAAMVEMISNREAYGRALVSLGEMNPDVVVLEADLGISTHTYMFGERFPDRFLELGIAESNMMGVAAGLALAGKIPYASTFCVFASMRACEQVRNSIAYPRLNVKIVATNAGIEIGADGVTHQAIEDIAIMRAIPEMTVVVPSDPVVTNKIIHQAADYDGPMYVRIGRQSTPTLYSKDVKVDLGEAITAREGDDVTLIAVGNMVCRSLEASEILAKQGVDARVLDMHTVKPIDAAALVKAAKETGCVVTAEDHTIMGGLGGAVAEVLSSESPVPLVRIGLRDVFAQSGEADELLEFYGLTAEKIAKAAQQVIRQRDNQS